jgi:hypothetical protein
MSSLVEAINNLSKKIDSIQESQLQIIERLDAVEKSQEMVSFDLTD